MSEATEAIDSKECFEVCCKTSVSKVHFRFSISANERFKFSEALANPLACFGFWEMGINHIIRASTITEVRMYKMDQAKTLRPGWRSGWDLPMGRGGPADIFLGEK